MNIQVSSNFERLLFDTYKTQRSEEKLPELMAEFERTGFLKVSDEVLRIIQKDFEAFSCDDENTKKIINEIFKNTGKTLDPHSAIGVYAAHKFFEGKNHNNEFVVSLATAHPAKFPEAVVSAGAPEPKLPTFLKDLMTREENFSVIKNNLEEVKQFIAERI